MFDMGGHIVMVEKRWRTDSPEEDLAELGAVIDTLVLTPYWGATISLPRTIRFHASGKAEGIETTRFRPFLERRPVSKTWQSSVTLVPRTGTGSKEEKESCGKGRET